MNAPSIGGTRRSIDERRDLVIPGDKNATLKFCVEHWLDCAKTSIAERGKFCVALSGGSTPKSIFQALASEAYRTQLDWNKVWLFWSDERSVAPDDIDSNYRMAMDAGLASLGIPLEQIFRMEAEQKIQEHAASYEGLLQRHASEGKLDLVMLGMGDDGHTASLFPKTEALKETGRLVLANHVPQKDSWRMTFSYKGIHQSRCIAFYVLGEAKQEMLKTALLGDSNLSQIPSQGVGLPGNKALWIADRAAAGAL